MCGIFLCACDQTDPTIKKILQNETIHNFLSRRGPDHFEKVKSEYRFSGGGGEQQAQQIAQLTLLSSVIQLRGCFVCNQPVQNEHGSILQWNGQIFAGLDPFDREVSDTEQLMRALSDADSVERFLKTISSIRGPWAFTFWDNQAKRLWIGRDILGRRSLCWNTNYRDEILLISSVAHICAPSNCPDPTNGSTIPDLNRFTFEEIPTLGIFCFEFDQWDSLAKVIENVRHFSWDRSIAGQLVVPELLSPTTLKLRSPITVSLNTELPDSEELLEKLRLGSDSNQDGLIPATVIEQFERHLSESVRIRCGNHHNVCKKCFARYVKHNERKQCHKQSISEVGIDGSTGIDWNGYSSDSDDEVRLGSHSTVNGISFRECCHASTAILFSGGLDSTVIALLTDQFVPEQLPIDLLNVAFNNDAPDRETGLRAWEELRILRPARKWNFVSIHIGKEELESYRQKHIRFLVKPSQTVLDDSIGCAVWFATRGKGLLMQEPGVITSTYQTRARVVLLGMGADEQLGGYSRHRKAFTQNGWRGLVSEMLLDVERISSRNLGRDDRVTADHGIEARYPFLDESVIDFLNGLPVWQKCNLNLDRSKGEKLLLRVMASQRLGLRQTSTHLKRAIQFGSRIAQLEVRTEKGDHLCPRLAC